MDGTPFFSIITPTFNRLNFLPILIDSLEKQTVRNFEWIVANDGSNDGTNEFLLNEINNLSFPIKYISSNLRIGKSMIDNILLDNVDGNFILMCDSDDFLQPTAVETFTKIITSDLFNSEISGVVSQNQNTLGETQTFKGLETLPRDGVYDWQELEKVLTGDGTICVRSDLLAHQRFPEVDFLSHEGVLLRDVYKNCKFFLTKNILKIMDRTAENSVTHGKKIEYSRGSAHAITKTDTIERFYKLSFKQRIFRVMNYFRYSIHGDISILESIKNWKVLHKNYFYVTIYFLSYLVCLRDIMMKKVVKTHIEFDKNKNMFKLTETTNSLYIK